MAHDSTSLSLGRQKDKTVTAKDQRPKNREVENEMIRNPDEEHVPPVPATQPSSNNQEGKNKRANNSTNPL